MSPKELLYIEDALNHEQDLKKSCTDLAGQLQDADLKRFVQGIADRQGTSYSQFYSLIK
jgi:hypothetical protein